MIWSCGSFVRAVGDPGPGIAATVLSTSTNRGQSSVVLEYTPPGGSHTVGSLGIPGEVARGYHAGQTTRVFLRAFFGSTHVAPAETLEITRRDDAVFAGIGLFGGLAAVVAALVVIRREWRRR